jgi:hypothetical protein
MNARKNEKIKRFAGGGDWENAGRIREAERHFLRRGWWLFPAAGLVAAMLTGGAFWAWVDGETPWLDWRQLFTARAVVLALAGLAVPAVWRVLLQRKWPGWAVALAVAAGFACAEAAVRIPAAQTAFWLAVGARLEGDGPYFLREVCYVRLEEAAGRTAAPGAVVLSGTSQMLVGVDEHGLAREIAPTPVIRREVSGMVPQCMLAAWSWIPFRQGDKSVQLRSEMDFTNQAEWRTAWYRPFLTWETLPWLADIAGRKACFRRWKEMADCAMAASLEGWRMRDGWREIAVNPWKRSQGTPKDAPESADVAAANAPLSWCEREWRAFVSEAEKLKAADVELVVFEGNVNPVLHDEQRAAMRREFERRMAEGVKKGLWRFVGEGELDAGILPEDWQDMTHVNAIGREKLTRAMGRVLGGGGERNGLRGAGGGVESAP